MKLPERYPLNGTFELTLRCNLHCKMCMFRHADTENAAMQAKELSAEQWISMAKQAADAGTIGLLLTGGEPLLRKDFAEIYQGIYPLGFLLTIYTNCILVTPEIMELFQKMPPHRLGITLYGSCNEDYEAVCGCADGFDRAMAGIRQLKTLPSVLEVRMTLTKDTACKADEIDRIVFEKFGIHPTLSANVFQSVRGGCMDVASCRMTPEQTVDATLGRVVARLEEKIPQELKGMMRLKTKEHCTQTGENYTLLGCDAGMKQYTITYDGRLLGCQMLGAFATDALAEGLAPAWVRFPTVVSLPEENPCPDCPLQNQCCICPAVSLAETGRLDGIPTYFCNITHLSQKRKEDIRL